MLRHLYPIAEQQAVQAVQAQATMLVQAVPVPQVGHSMQVPQAQQAVHMQVGQVVECRQAVAAVQAVPILAAAVLAEQRKPSAQHCSFQAASRQDA